VPNDTLGTDDALSVVSKSSLRIDIAVEGNELDPVFPTQFGDGCVPVRHGCLYRPDLRLGQGRIPTVLAAARPGRPKPGDRPFTDEFALEFRKRGEDAEGQPPGRGRRVDLVGWQIDQCVSIMAMIPLELRLIGTGTDTGTGTGTGTGQKEHDHRSHRSTENDLV